MIYLLFYDQDTGEWNTFYTPIEAFSTAELRQARITELEAAVDDEGDPMNYVFHRVQVELDQSCLS